MMPNKSPEPTAVGAVQFRCRGSRRESAVAQLFSLGGITLLCTKSSEEFQNTDHGSLGFLP